MHALATKSSLGFGVALVGALVSVGSVGCGAAAEGSDEAVGSSAAALTAPTPALYGEVSGELARAEVVCDTDNAVYTARFAGEAPAATAEGFPAGVPAALTVWDRAGKTARELAGATNRSGRSSLSFAFAEGPETAAAASYSVIRNNLLSPARTTYASLVSKTEAGARTSVACRNVERVVVQCITDRHSIYVTRDESGAYAYAAYDVGSTTPNLTLAGGELREGSEESRFTFTNGSYRYIVRFSPFDAEAPRGSIVVRRRGRTLLDDRCQVLGLGQGSPGRVAGGVTER